MIEGDAKSQLVAPSLSDSCEKEYGLASYRQANDFMTSANVNGEELDIDEVLRRTGQCGRYQICVMGIMMVVGYVTAFAILMFYFIGHSPPWRCASYTNSSASQYAPFDSSASKVALLAVGNNSALQNVSSTGYAGFCDVKTNINKNFESHNKARCHMPRERWMFVTNKSTLVTEFDLVCEKTSEDALIGSSVFMGWGIGCLIMGTVSDHYGRKKAMFICLFFLVITHLLQAFVTAVWQMVALRFLLGVFVSCASLNSHVFLAEVAGPERRVLVSTVGGSAWTLGLIVMTFKAYLIDSWRTLVIVSSAPYICIMGLWFWTPESIRWLNSNGRTVDAENMLRKVARINNQPVFNFTLKNVESVKRKYSYIDLFKTCQVAKLVIVQSFLWLNCGLSYYGLALAADGFGGSMYVNFLLSVVVEIPGRVIEVILLQRLGRKKTGICTFFLVGAFCIALALVYIKDGSSGIKVAVGTLAKLVSGMTFGTMYIWSIEFFPTVVRTQGMGIGVVSSRIGAGISPFVVTSLKQISSPLPFIVMGAGSLASCFLCFLLPETYGKPTRESIEDLEGPLQYRYLRGTDGEGLPLQVRVADRVHEEGQALCAGGSDKDVDVNSFNGGGDLEEDVLLSHVQV